MKSLYSGSESEATPETVTKAKSVTKKRIRNAKYSQGIIHKQGSGGTIEAIQKQINEMKKVLNDLTNQCNTGTQPSGPNTVESQPNMSFGRVAPLDGPQKRCCFYCKSEGHFTRDCPKRINDLQLSEAPLNTH